MSLEVRRMRATHYELSAEFDWYDPPEEARTQFVCVAHEVAVLLTVSLGYAVSVVGSPNVSLGDGRSMGGPWHYKLGCILAGPDESEWRSIATLVSRQQFSPLLDDLALRYRASLDSPDDVLAHAYFCLTCIESAAGSRRAAARRYAIEYGVLRTLGEISANVGDSRTARKHPKRQATAAELVWVREAFRRIILQVAQAHPKQLGMADLPPLE